MSKPPLIFETTKKLILQYFALRLLLVNLLVLIILGCLNFYIWSKFPSTSLLAIRPTVIGILAGNVILAIVFLFYCFKSSSLQVFHN